MPHDMTAIEATRAKFRPQRITTLFVGESAPISGDFVYDGDNAMLTHMRVAIERDLGASDDFLTTFKSYGWYIDDLVLIPVNHLNQADRKTALRGSQSSLAVRIAEYQPVAIVSLLKSIRGYVEAAAKAAGSNAIHYAVPFPGMGQQGRFHKAMAEIIPNLPRIGEEMDVEKIFV